MHDWGDWGFGFGHWAFGIVFWIVLIALVAFALMGLTGSRRGNGAGPSKNALDILKERYARGEIDKDEYERMKKDIER